MRPIDADALMRSETKRCGTSPVVGTCTMNNRFLHNVLNEAPTLDVAPVVHGHWVLKVHSFYADNYDESTELVVYITATCSECCRRHPDSYEVYHETLSPPDEAETNEDFCFDRGYEEANALEKFEQRGYAFAHYCPNCGAKMNGVLRLRRTKGR